MNLFLCTNKSYNTSLEQNHAKNKDCIFYLLNFDICSIVIKKFITITLNFLLQEIKFIYIIIVTKLQYDNGLENKK